MKKNYKKITLVAITFLAILCLFLFLLFNLPKKQNEKKFNNLADTLIPIIKADSLEADTIATKIQEFEEMQKQKPYKKANLNKLLIGAQSFLQNDLNIASKNMESVLKNYEDDYRINSFLATINLKQGNPAKAKDLYQNSLNLQKKELITNQIVKANNELGLALAYFLLQEPEKSLSPAQNAWQTRVKILGEAHDDSLSAANRLATILIALDLYPEAEKLTYGTYDLSINKDPRQISLVAQETQLLINTIDTYNQKIIISKKMQEEIKALENFSLDNIKPLTEETIPTESELKQWEIIARALIEEKHPLAIELIGKILNIKIKTAPTNNKYSPSMWPWHINLTKAYLATQQYQNAQELTWVLIKEALTAPEPTAELSILYALLAEAQEGENLLLDAEHSWRLAVELSGLIDNEDQRIPHVLNCNLNLAENLLKQGRSLTEVEIELRAGMSKFKNLGRYANAAETYLKLARIIKNTGGRSKDSQAFYQRAKTVALIVLKKSSDTQEIKKLNYILEASEYEVGQNRILAVKKEIKSPIPSHSYLRTELSALATLGRIDDFTETINQVMKDVSSVYATDSQQYFRYYSLWLKYLEESKKYNLLNTELTKIINNPPGNNNLEKAISQVSALSYAARIYTKTKDYTQAKELYDKALTTMQGITKDEQYKNYNLHIRLEELEEEIKSFQANKDIIDKEITNKEIINKEINDKEIIDKEIENKLPKQ